MFTWKRFLLASCATLLLALMFIIFILPGIISDRAKSWVAEETGRTLEIESISINPFSLSVEMRKLSLSDTDQTAEFVSWDLLRVSLSVASIYHRAPVIDELRLDLPQIHLERLTADRFNFSDLIPEKDASSDESNSEPLRFSVNNISIKGGRIELIDSSLDEQVHHTITDLELSLPSIGNLPFMVDNPAQPLFRATVNDAPINLEGELKAFTDSQQMRLGLVLENIDLPFYLGYVPVELPVELRNGKLSLDLDILYRITADDGAELVLSGQIDLASLDIWDQRQEKLFFLPLLQIEMAPTQPLKQYVHLSSLRVYNLEVQLNRDSGGEWNHARMASAEKTASPPEETLEEEDSSPFRLQVDSIEIRDGVLFFEDNLPAGGFSTVAREININVKNFSLQGQEGIPIDLTLETDHDENLSVKGHFLLNPFTLALQTELRDLQTAAYAPYYSEGYSVPLEGRMTIEARLDVNPNQPLLVSQGYIAWRDAYMAFNDKEGLGLELVELTDLSFDLAQNRLEIATYHGENAQMSFSRSKDGRWSLLSENFPILAKLTETADEAPPAPTKSEGPEFNYRIGEFAFINWKFDITDKQPATPVHLQARNFNLAFRNLAAPEKVLSPFEFSSGFGRRGQVKLSGKASLADQTLDLEGQLKNIALTSFAPYVAEQANLVLESGALNVTMKAAIAPGREGFDIRFDGDLGINSFHLLDGTHREDLLKWDSLQVARFKGQTEPLQLSINSVTLSDYFAKVLIDEDARLNLTNVFDKEAPSEDQTATEESEQPVETTPEEAAEAEPEGPKPDIQVATVILQGGHVDFTDRSLPRPFHADMRELGGRVQGLSADPATRAEVDLRGRLRNQSPLVISGTINPLAEKLFLDLKLNFNDIELSPLSSYSGTYVGYLIEKGKLNLALEYYIEDDQLKAKNKVFLDQFSFGEAVESEQATSLPVNLAVALLKDRNGEIHLDIPVTGSLDDPQFSIAGVVWTIIKNLLVKAATSPFALLGALVGGGEEDFSNVSFAYGSPRLEPAEKDKLQRMSQALKDRPSLEVEVSGFIDPDNDAEGYRREQLSIQIKRLKYLDLIDEETLPEGVREEDVIVPAEEYADYLWQVYRKADFPKPRSFIGMTKKLPVAEMEKLIHTNTPVTQDDLEALAQARALRVQNFLIEEGQLASERVFLKKPDITAEPAQETTLRARVELGAKVR